VPDVAESVMAARLKPRWEARLDDCVSALAWSPDGRQLTAAGLDGPIRLFEASTGRVTATLAGHAQGTLTLAWRPDGTALASGGQDGMVRWWDAGSDRQLAEGKGGAGWVEHMQWHSTGKLLATAAGKSLRFWDAPGKLSRECADHASTIAGLAWRPDGGMRLITVAYGGATLWNPERVEPVRRLPWNGSSLSLAWSPDGKYLAAGQQDGCVHLWITKNGEDLEMSGFPTKVRALAWDATSRWLATDGSATVCLWDCSGKGPARRRPVQLEAHQDLVSALAFQPVGDSLASGGADGRVFLWRLGNSEQPLGMLEAGSPVAKLAWKPDGKQVAVGTEDGKVAVL